MGKGSKTAGKKNTGGKPGNKGSTKPSQSGKSSSK